MSETNNQNESSTPVTEESKYAYNAKLLFHNYYHNHIIYNRFTMDNMFYKDQDGKINIWHRKRKNKYVVFKNVSILYIDDDAYMSRFSSSTYTNRNLYLVDILNNKAVFSVWGSAKFDDSDHYYIGLSDDGTLVEAGRKFQGDEGYWFAGATNNKKGKLGCFYREYYEEEEDYREFCINYDGLNVTIDVVIESYIPTSIPHKSFMYPVEVYGYLRDTSYNGYDQTKNIYQFACAEDNWVEYYDCNIYNANTKTFMNVPPFVECQFMKSVWSKPSGGEEVITLDLNTMSYGFLRTLCVSPFIYIVGICPNGNILMCIMYIDTLGGDKTRYPEYSRFKRFYITPQYYVINTSSGTIEKSNIVEPLDIDVRGDDTKWYIDPEKYPVYMYTDDQYLWFRKGYADGPDITFYATSDGYNIDKQIIFYNRTSIQLACRDTSGSYSTFTLPSNRLGEFPHAGGNVLNIVPLFENGIFKKNVISIELLSGYRSYGYAVIDGDLTPDSEGIIRTEYLYCPFNTTGYNTKGAKQTRLKPGQSVDNYVFEIE